MPDLIVVGVSVIALATSLSSLLYTRRMAHEAQRANDVAAQSQEDERQLHAVRWVIERAHGDGLLLRNTGYETADEVYVDVPDMLAISDVPLGQTSVAPGDAVAIAALRLHRPRRPSTSQHAARLTLTGVAALTIVGVAVGVGVLGGTQQPIQQLHEHHHTTVAQPPGLGQA